MQTKVLLVDDHDIVRFGIKRLLQDVKDIKVVGETSSGEESLNLVRQLEPHVILMDLKMPGIDGMEATRKISRSYPDVKIIMLTMCTDEPYPSRMLECGAAGYVTKDCDMEELVRAIRTVSLGQCHLSPIIAQNLALKNIRNKEASPFDSLSEREMQIMLMITNGSKIQDIADKLCLSSKTVNTYRYRAFSKLSVSSDVELTHLAIRHNLLEING